MPSNSSRSVFIRLLAVVLAGVALVWLALTLLNQRPGDRGPRAGGAQAPATTRSESSTADTVRAAADFQVALDRARELQDPRQRSIQFGQLFERRLRSDPEASVAYLRSLTRTTAEYSCGLRLAVRMVAARSPEEALKLAAELVATNEQRTIYNELFAEWAQTSPATAVQRLSFVSTAAARENAVRAIAETWAQGSFDAACAWAQALTGPDRVIAIESALSVIAVSDPVRSVQLARVSLSGPALDRTLGEALQVLVRSDVRGAAAVVSLLTPGVQQSGAAAQVAQALAATNPPDAANWARTLTDPAARSAATRRAFEIWAANDPVGARNYVTAMPADEVQRDAIGVLSTAGGRSDPASAVTWAQSLPQGALRALALVRIADAWAQRDPAAVARWTLSDSAAGLGNLSAPALNGALSYWVFQDSVAAQEFVRSLPAASQAEAAAYLAPLLAQREPTQAIAWAQSLADPASREAAVAAAYQRWLRNAPAEAKAWLTSASLAPEEKARLQKGP